MRKTVLGCLLLLSVVAAGLTTVPVVWADTYVFPQRQRSADAGGQSKYERFNTPPWPITEVANPPFAFKPSEKHKRGLLLPWAALTLKENTQPTFGGDELAVNDPVLQKFWQAMYQKIVWYDRPRQISYVNHFMNRFDYGEDIDVWGLQDYWATPREFMEKKRGDCKAIAIAKYYALRALGVPAADMYLVTVNDPTAPKGAFHLVLVVFDGGDLYVLDMDPNKGATRNSAYRQYTAYDYFNEIESREIKK